MKLTEFKTLAKLQIDRDAEYARSLYITLGSGMAQVYDEKLEEASDFIAAGYPLETRGYPYIEAEMEALDKKAKQVADDIVNAKSNWQQASVQIEKIRLKGKRAIDRATSFKKVRAERDSTLEALALI